MVPGSTRWQRTEEPGCAVTPVLASLCHQAIHSHYTGGLSIHGEHADPQGQQLDEPPADAELSDAPVLTSSSEQGGVVSWHVRIGIQGCF